jgi:hydrogenase 3 maturation protease
MEQPTWQNQLDEWLKDVRKIVVMGIGNPMRKDDAVGIHVVTNMIGSVSNRVELMRVDTVPESFTANVRRADPSHVLLVDAAEFGEKAGSIKFVGAHDADGFSVSTHSMPLKVLATFLEKTSHAKIALLAIQPKVVEMGDDMTPELVESAKEISRNLIQLLP